jgi:hypothetical protein
VDGLLTPPVTTDAAPAATAPASVPAPSPDLPCPLCDYALRGQTEPRCPECGYRFDWPQLLDPELRRHPYLFEHHPRRNVRSFVRTLLGGLRPRRFWRSLRPSQPSDVRRLVMYWLIATLLMLAWPVADVARLFYTDAAEYEAIRARMVSSMQAALRRPNMGLVQQQVARAGGVQAWVDDRHPPTWSWRYLKGWFVGWSDGGSGVGAAGRWPVIRSTLHVPLFYALWPWLTLATLMIFRASMRRARVKTAHVLRCALYSCDIGVMLVPLAAAIGYRGAYVFVPALGGMGIDYRMLAAVVFAAYTGYRLSAAYALYMRFDRPAATAAASQGIVLLLVLVGLSWWPPITY